MSRLIVRSLKEGEERALFGFAERLEEKGSWGKKTLYLRSGYRKFQRFLKYVRAFRVKCLLVAVEDDRIVGFAIAVLSTMWNRELAERYGRDIETRAHVLGVAFNEGRRDVLGGLTTGLCAYFSKEGIRSIEYPSFGNICLTTATDVLTPENVDALLMFREAGFRISDCYYSMRLNVEGHPIWTKHQGKRTRLQVEDRRLELVIENQVLAKITWDSIRNCKTSIGIFIKKAYRRKGLGTALMAETLSYLRNKGVKSIELGVDGNNIAALKLYRKFGFEVYATHFYLVMPC